MTFVYPPDLISIIKKIRKSDKSLAFQANQLLTLSKPTPENLEIYSIKNRHLLLLHELLNLSKNSLKLLFGLLSVGWRAPIRAKSESGAQKSLFISHYFANMEDSIDISDPFFGHIPNLSLNRGLVPVIHFIDQVSSGFRISKRLPVVNQTATVIIGIKRLNVQILLLYFNDLCIAFKLFWRSFSANNHVRSLILRIAVAQVSLQTFRNHIIAQHVLDEIQTGEYKEIWLTFEGHAFERSILNTIKEAKVDVDINLYQHAPIVPGQIGLMELLEDFGSIVNVYTSGIITYNYLQSAFPELVARIHVAGSIKHSPKNDTGRISTIKKRDHLLFLPEGTTKSLFSMVSLAVTASTLDNSVKMIFRIHPNTPIKAAEAAKILLHKRDIRVSYGTLIGDFRSSYACIYRSSAAVIESLNYGLLPIHFNPSGDRELDCLALSSIRYPIVYSAQSLVELLCNQKLEFSSALFSEEVDFIEFSKMYFTPSVTDI